MKPRFLDTDANLRKAREKAYKYLHISLADRTYGNLHLPPKTLEQTVAQDLLKQECDPDMAAAIEASGGPESAFAVTAYDPDAETRQREDGQRAEQDAANEQRFREIFTAIQTLSNTDITALAPEVSRSIRRTLSDAPEFLARIKIHPICTEEVAAHENIGHAADIARINEATRFRHAKDAAKFVELPPGEPQTTKHLLEYIHAHFCTLEMAVNYLLLAVNSINAAFEGRELGGESLSR